MRPILPPPSSVNHRLPSGPLVMPSGLLLAVGIPLPPGMKLPLVEMCPMAVRRAARRGRKPELFMLLPLFLSSHARLLVAKPMGRCFTNSFLLFLMRDIFRLSASAYLYGEELHRGEWHEARVVLICG